MNHAEAKETMQKTGKTLAILILATTSLFPVPTVAVEFRAGQTVVVEVDEVISDDLYASGETVTIDGTVEGDLIVSGREITLNGTVEGDLMAAGQAVIVNGRVTDDARIAGMALIVGSGAQIGDDLLAAGFSLETETKSGVYGSLGFTGYQALLAGSVGEDLSAACNALELRSAIGGNVRAQVEGDGAAPPFMSWIPSPVALPTVEPGLTVSESASIGGKLDYTSTVEGRIDPGTSVSGSVTRTETKSRERVKPTLGQRALAQLRWLVGTLIVGLLLFWLAPRWVDALVERVSTRPFPSLGWGLTGLVGVPAAMLVSLGVVGLLAVTLGILTLGRLVGLTLGLGLFGESALALGFWFALGFVGHIVVGLILGRRLLERVSPARARGRGLQLLLGLMVLAAVGLVPLLGGLVRLLAALLGLGAIGAWLFDHKPGHKLNQAVSGA